MRHLPALFIVLLTVRLVFFAQALRAEDHGSYCASMQFCLGEMPKDCSEEDFSKGDIPKADTYCELFRNLQERGLRSTSWQGRQIYRQISGRHRVEYAQQGTLPMSAEVLVHLMNDLPFAAQLINAYQGTDFEAAYLDESRKRFYGSGERLSGTFTTMLQNDNQTSSLYNGYGTANILAWSLRGTALFTFDFDESAPSEITYHARCFVFPRSAFVRSILNFILFRRTITGELKQTFGYVEDSAMAFHRGEREPIENYPAFDTSEGQRKIEEFKALLQRTMPAQEGEALP